jgi:hypothetical protein
MEDSLFGGTLGDALGVSQGQGRGLAQVFDSTYSTAFKDAAALELKSDKEDKKLLNSRLVKLAENKVWDRDQPLLQEKLNDINAYAQQNYRQIGKGNTPEAFELSKKISDVTQFAYASLKTEKEWAARALEVEKKTGNYDYEESDNRLKQMLLSPGNMDVSQMSLVPEFNTTNFEKSLSGNILRMLLKDPEVSIPSGKDIHGNAIYNINQDVAKEKLDLMAENSWNDLQPYQQKKYNNDFDAFKQMVYNYAPSKDRVVIQGEAPKPKLSEEAENKPYEFTYNNQYSFSQAVGSKSGLHGFTNDKTPVLIGTNFVPSDKTQYDPRKIRDYGGVIIGLTGTYQAEKTDDGGYDLTEDGFDLDSSTNIMDAILTNKGSFDFQAREIQKMPVFKKGTETIINGRTIPLSNRVVSEDMIKKGEIGNLTLSDKNVEWVPMVVGTYNQEIESGTQGNVEIGIPYDKYRGSLQTGSTSSKELTKLEKQNESKQLLTRDSYSQGLKNYKGEKGNTTQSTEKKEAKKLTMETFKNKYPNSYNVLSKVKDEYVKKYEKYVSQIDEDKTPLSPEAFLKKLNLTESQYKK